MKPLVRLVTRDAGNGQVDLVLGAAFKGQDVFKPNRVYQIEDVLGVPTIRDLGPAAIGDTRQDSLLHVSWANDVGHVLSVGQSHHLLTAEEFRQLVKKG